MSKMLFLLKKDLKITLPAFAMFIMAFFAMCIMTAYGIFTKNGDFTVTALYIFYFVLIAVCLYMIFQGANQLRKNLSNDEYMSKVLGEGFTRYSFVTLKLVWTVIIAEILYVIYVLGFSLMLVLADTKIKDVSKELGEQKFVPGGEVLLTAISGLFLVAAVAAFVYTGFLLCYRYFLRGKYALYGSFSTTFCVFFVVWKLYDLIVPKNGVDSSLGTIIYCTIIFITCILLNLAISKKMIFYKGE